MHANKYECSGNNQKHESVSIPLSKREIKENLLRLIQVDISMIFFAKFQYPASEKVTGSQLQTCWGDDVRLFFLRCGINLKVPYFSRVYLRLFACIYGFLYFYLYLLLK